MLFFSFHFREEVIRNNNTIIFIIDSEVEAEFLSSPARRIEAQSSHGSKVAALIRTQSRAEIKAVSAADQGRIQKEKYLSALAEIAEYRENNPQKNILINISLGFEESDFQAEKIKKLSSDPKTLIIAAAGNNNRENLTFPAAFKEVTAVAALENNQKMPASNYGPDVDISASGIIEINEYLRLPAGNFSRKYKITGTSYAAPQLTALTAELLSYQQNLNPAAALEIIKTTASAINDPLFAQAKLGTGEINSFKALARAQMLYPLTSFIIYFSLIIALIIFTYLCWQKYSLSGIFAAFITAVFLFFLQPYLILTYRQFGALKIILFIIFFLFIYLIIKNLLFLLLGKTNNFNLILLMGGFLNGDLRTEALKRAEEIIAKNPELKIKLKRELNKQPSIKKGRFQLQIMLSLKNPDLNLIIKKAKYYNFDSKAITAELKKGERNKNEKAELNFKLLSLILNADYQKKKTAAEIAAQLKEELLLIPIKNLLKKRNSYNLDQISIYFLLEILAEFNNKAADLAPLLKEIILNTANPWLKYYSLLAYQNTAPKDDLYREFIKEIRKKEKEPVILALKKEADTLDV